MTCVQEDGWKLSRNNYYQEGWLATANVRGVVGVTFTTSFCGGQQAADIPARTNYNLRGHRSEVGNLRGHRSEVGKLRGHRSEVGNPRGHRSEVGNLRGHRSEVGNRTLKIHAACTHLYVDNYSSRMEERKQRKLFLLSCRDQLPNCVFLLSISSCSLHT